MAEQAQPLVSIIVNNHNYAEYLWAAIASALQQNYPSTEVIVVDDGSTDGSREVIASFGRRIIPVLKPNGGQASALNAGFAHSRGDVVIFLDADDLLRPEAAGLVAEVFRRQPGTAKVMYRMAVVDGAGQATGAVKPAPHLPLRSGDLRRAVVSAASDLVWMPTSGNAFAAHTLRRILPIPEAAYGHVGADWYLAHLAPLCGPVVFLEEIGADYRVHGRNHYEVAQGTVDLDHVRQTVRYAALTRRYIRRYAKESGIVPADSTCEERAVAALANRLISLRMAPARHPLAEDRTHNLLWMGTKAALRRSDVATAMRLLFVAWFAAMAMAPQPAVEWLARLFLYPEQRMRMNRTLASFHRPHPPDVVRIAMPPHGAA
jgi:glycosyltransferase involved in cell wall biosynthesis